MKLSRIMCASLLIAGLLQATLVAVPAVAYQRVWDRHFHRYVYAPGGYHYGVDGRVIFGAAVATAVAASLAPRPVYVTPGYAPAYAPAYGAPAYVTYGEYDPYFTSGYGFYDRGGYRYYRNGRGVIVGRVAVGVVRRHRGWRR